MKNRYKKIWDIRCRKMSENIEKGFAFLTKYAKLECGVVGLLIIELETFY